MNELRFKKIVLATGEEFENGIIKDCEELYFLEEGWLPSSIKEINFANQRILVNTDFILTIELETIRKVV